MRLEKGKKAETPGGMRHNVKTMEKAGYSKKRAEGTAYGEVGMAKMARKHESEGMKKSEKEMHHHHKEMIKHHKKEMEHHEKMMAKHGGMKKNSDAKEDKKLVKTMVKKDCIK